MTRESKVRSRKIEEDLSHGLTSQRGLLVFCPGTADSLVVYHSHHCYLADIEPVRFEKLHLSGPRELGVRFKGPTARDRDQRCTGRLTFTVSPRRMLYMYSGLALEPLLKLQRVEAAMGNDGGSIPKRRELVKEAAKNPSASELKESQHEQQEYFWTTDPISHKPLAQPVFSDCNGRLYNKDTILEYLVEGSRKEDAESVTRGSIKSLKDVVEVKFEVDNDAAAKATGNTGREVWTCPVTGDRLGPGSKAVYLVPCGHAFSSSAIKEVSGEKCLICETEYASNDIIPILPTSETDIARLSLRDEDLARERSHSLSEESFRQWQET